MVGDELEKCFPVLGVLLKEANTELATVQGWFWLYVIFLKSLLLYELPGLTGFLYLTL